MFCPTFTPLLDEYPYINALTPVIITKVPGTSISRDFPRSAQVASLESKNKKSISGPIYLIRIITERKANGWLRDQSVYSLIVISVIDKTIVKKIIDIIVGRFNPISPQTNSMIVNILRRG
jgi:hypothetical protein